MPKQEEKNKMRKYNKNKSSLEINTQNEYLIGKTEHDKMKWIWTNKISGRNTNKWNKENKMFLF